ncbi:hypothetical protein [Streptomyces antimycoticus]|uniref:hypothetical protein n=1 Tax=Streptomyces antimycoticus TaxID=68175 RepID=UPI000F7B0604|nr:hypothetical protein EF902_06130 [Streptomyces sp. WAC05858]
MALGTTSEFAAVGVTRIARSRTDLLIGSAVTSRPPALPHAATGHGLPPGFPESHTVRGDLAAGATYDLFLLVGAVLGLLLIDRIS